MLIFKLKEDLRKASVSVFCIDISDTLFIPLFSRTLSYPRCAMPHVLLERIKICVFSASYLIKSETSIVSV